MFYFIITYEMYYLYTFKSQKISVDFKKKMEDLLRDIQS